MCVGPSSEFQLLSKNARLVQRTKYVINLRDVTLVLTALPDVHHVGPGATPECRHLLGTVRERAPRSGYLSRMDSYLRGTTEACVGENETEMYLGRCCYLGKHTSLPWIISTQKRSIQK